MRQNDIEDIEVDLLLEAIYRRYGYDFRSYARASVDRRVRLLRDKIKTNTIAELIPLVLHDEEVFSQLVQGFSITVTEMFRDPGVYRAVREQVIPVLESYPFVKVWAAGCSTGEEAYSLAIVLAESGLTRRSTIFGTDFNDYSLTHAKQGVYPVDRIKEFTRNYQDSGGTRSFSDYYHAAGNSALIAARIKERVTFANHNLTTDGNFGEMHLVLCRNVLIYFNRELQNRALRLFAESLINGGFLILGAKEDLQFSEVAGEFELLDRAARIYKRRGR